MADLSPFHTLLQKRNIDPDALRSRLPEVYDRWQALAERMHPESFLAQVRFEINAVRRDLQGSDHLDLRLNEPAPQGLAPVESPPGPVGEADAGVA